MVETATARSLRIDELIDSLMERWEELPRVEREISGWDRVDQIDFVEEWPLTEELLIELRGYVASGALSPTQVRRYGALTKLVARNRPMIGRLQQV